jgi:hypothetical protein
MSSLLGADADEDVGVPFEKFSPRLCSVRVSGVDLRAEVSV